MKKSIFFIVILLIVLNGFTQKNISGCDKSKSTVVGNNKFAFEIFDKLIQKDNEDENIFFSPFSISFALAMTYAGARGETEKEMSEVLHFNSVQEKAHSDFKQLFDTLNNTGKGTVINITNALWGQKGYKFLPEFIQLIDNYYSGNFRELDFLTQTEESRLIINEWVEERTNNLIKELIKPKDLSPLTKLVLTNAIYFNGQWQNPFDEKFTKLRPFYLNESNTTETMLMKNCGYYHYYENDIIKVLELPYKEEDKSMIVLLPKSKDGIREVQKSLSFEKYKYWISSVKRAKVDVILLPKFKYSSHFSLEEILKSMGMIKAFSSADFSGMTGNSDLCISDIIHEAFVDVNEVGTEAAAATAVIMFNSIGKIFIADHPFIYIIKDNKTESILFIGRLINPNI